MNRRARARAYAKLRIALKSKRQVEAIANALKPELLHPASEKAWATIARHGKTLKLEFTASDSSSLRAIISSYLRMIAASLNVSNALLELDKSRSESR